MSPGSRPRPSRVRTGHSKPATTIRIPSTIRKRDIAEPYLRIWGAGKYIRKGPRASAAFARGVLRQRRGGPFSHDLLIPSFDVILCMEDDAGLDRIYLLPPSAAHLSGDFMKRTLLLGATLALGVGAG